MPAAAWTVASWGDDGDYPEGVWYHYDTKADVDEILERHVLKGERVERLLLQPGQTVLAEATRK